MTALFDDDTRAQIRESVLGEARGIARSVFDKVIVEEMRRLIDLYITHSFGGVRVRFQEALEKAFKELMKEQFSKDDISKMFREATEDSLAELNAREREESIRSIVRSELKSRFE